MGNRGIRGKEESKYVFIFILQYTEFSSCGFGYKHAIYETIKAKID
jgi:hypothetical protein